MIFIRLITYLDDIEIKYILSTYFSTNIKNKKYFTTMQNYLITIKI